jgi:hypothetical protein
MLAIYRDSMTPKKRFSHYNILGFKFRVKTYRRDSIIKYNIYTDNQGLGINFKKHNVKLYRK